MILKSQADLDACVVKWQRILRLQDWEIKARLATRPAEMVNPNAEARGQNAIYATLKSCEISVNVAPDAVVHPCWDDSANDHESILVHELLHIPFRFNKPKRDTLQHEMWEQSIEVMAQSLVALDRSMQPEPAPFNRAAKLVTAPTNGKVKETV